MSRNVKGQGDRIINKLDQKQMYALIELVKAKYVEMATTDVEFAAFATNNLGFQIKNTNVASARVVLDLPSTKFVKEGTPIERLEAQVLLLLASVQKLDERVKTLENVVFKR